MHSFISSLNVVSKLQFFVQRTSILCNAKKHYSLQWKESRLFVLWTLEQLQRCSVFYAAKNISHIQSLVIHFFLTPPRKLKLGLQIRGRLLIATHLDEALGLVNQKRGAAVGSKLCKNARFCWAKPTCFDFSLFNDFNFQDHILSTPGDALTVEDAEEILLVPCMQSKVGKGFADFQHMKLVICGWCIVVLVSVQTLFKCLAITFSTITLFTGIVPLYGSSLMYAGPVGVVWGWVVVTFFTWFVGFAMAEICSSFPVSFLHNFLVAWFIYCVVITAILWITASCLPPVTSDCCVEYVVSFILFMFM